MTALEDMIAAVEANVAQQNEAFGRVLRALDVAVDRLGHLEDHAGLELVSAALLVPAGDR